ncbi:MAG: hypothetical protein IPK60_02740 [Sandaracinaceae bacterium]|nr:hypothetical protein [Sandaracinaceae bacterium]
MRLRAPTLVARSIVAASLVAGSLALGTAALAACGGERRDHGSGAPSNATTPASTAATPGPPVCFAANRMTAQPGSDARSLGDPSDRSAEKKCGLSLSYDLGECQVTLLVGEDDAHTPTTLFNTIGPDGVPTSELPLLFGPHPRAIRGFDTRILTIQIENAPSETLGANRYSYAVFERDGLVTPVTAAITQPGANNTNGISPSCAAVAKPWLARFFGTLQLTQPYAHLDEVQLPGPDGRDYVLALDRSMNASRETLASGESVTIVPRRNFGEATSCARIELMRSDSPRPPLQRSTSPCAQLRALGRSWSLCLADNPARVPRGCDTMAQRVAVNGGGAELELGVTGTESERSELISALSRARVVESEPARAP